MKKALVIHPDFTVYGGGEFLSLNICSILQRNGYEVTLATNNFHPEVVGNMYGSKWREVMSECFSEHIPEFFYGNSQKTIAVKRIFYARHIRKMFLKDKYDISFSTQSSVFNPDCPQHHFVYHPSDIFCFPRQAKTPTGLGHSIYYRFALKSIGSMMVPDDPDPDNLFCLGSITFDSVKKLGYSKSSMIFPPCEMPFEPMRKTNTIIQATRITPEKKIEWFFEAARRLPEYAFILVGRDSTELRAFNPGYAEKILQDIPTNVLYTNSSIRDVKYLIEQAKVYLYTGDEPGMGITQMESIGAGCIPICRSKTGGEDVVRISGKGHAYSTVDQMVEKIKLAINSTDSVESIQEASSKFSLRSFEEEIVTRCKI